MMSDKIRQKGGESTGLCTQTTLSPAAESEKALTSTLLGSHNPFSGDDAI